ncbi:hypothetical protein AS189_09050 [Arthrobacter alpinus]|uniref:Uncharacterized protein n=1 Tax=Arthrobacter alpinus TaxID=656366 RepID=A0A0S2LZF0_9MICC|nr:hypothetical protein AS189_09050 [Arthrobacter alpinus]
MAAFNHWYAAEVGRARAESDNAAQWTAAAEQGVQFLWEETYCCLQGTESVLLRGHTQRAIATPWLPCGPTTRSSPD